MTSLRSGIGTSGLADATAAGRAAATDAIRGLGGERPALILVYASVSYDLASMLAGIREVTGDTPLAGATSSGLFHAGTFTAPGNGVAVLALTAGPYQFGVSSVTDLSRDPDVAGSTLARAARDAAGPERLGHAAILLLTDGLAGDQQTLLNGIYRVAGAAVPIAGGAAGDDRLLQGTFVFDGDRVLGDAAVAIWVDADRPLKVVAHHGWEPVGVPLMVTKVDGTVVQELAGRPALEVFEEQLRLGLGEGLRPINERGYDSAHALGLIEPDGTRLIRAVVIGDDRIVRTFTPIPLYAAVQIVFGRSKNVLDVGDLTVKEALAAGDASMLLGFSCVARMDLLGERSAEEARRLQDAAGSVPTFGFYTYGEFARTTSVAGYHNATIAAIAL
jgi:hypothetical protein